jgi:ABC-type polar amino acid transport system ATPase subunit
MTTSAIAASDVHLRRGSREVLRGIDFEVAAGEVVALMGVSGSGKSTILRAIAGLEPFERGTIALEGAVLPAGPPRAPALRELRRKVGMVFQFHCLFEHLSALDNVTLAPLHVQRTTRADAERRARELLATLGVEHRAAALPRELSGGEAQRVAIARALATDPHILLMDEPTASLDPERRQELQSLVRSLAGRNRTLLIATHDQDFAEGAATRVLYVRDGRIAQPG